MVGGSLRVLRLLPPLKLVAMIFYCRNIAESSNKHNQSINTGDWLIGVTAWAVLTVETS
jgi:hypothetical protein